MRNRLWVVLPLTLAMIFAANAVNYDEAVAVGQATSWISWSKSAVATQCKDCGPICFAGNSGPTSSATCQSGPNENQTRAFAYAEAEGLFANVHVYDEIKAAYSDWAWGKGGPPEKQDFVYITDSLFANAAWVPGPPITITIHIQGFMSIQPEDNGAVRTWFDIALRQESTDEVYFEGEARLTGGHNPRLTCSGDLGEEDFTVTTDASKTTARINKNYVFAAQVDTTDLELQLQVAGRTDEAPAITGWGVLALVTLLVVSAVFIMLRRKRVSAAALG